MTGAGWEAFRHWREGPVDLLLGDARRVLAAMPDAMVDTVVTSPPFWSLRDYGTGRWDGRRRHLPLPGACAPGR
jgi:DNA modification methylase